MTTLPLSEILLVFMGLLAVAMVVAGVAHGWPIPFTVLLVGVGISLGVLSRHWEPLHPLAHFHLTPELVLFVFLPTLIFESGYNLNARRLLKDIAPIMAMAVPALLLSSVLIGLGLCWLLEMPLILSLLFGTLISATDPVAVIALFRELGAPQRLTVLVEGESLLNDATAIVVFNIVLAIALTGMPDWREAGLAFFSFFRVFIGGILVGALFGFFFSEWMHRLRGEISGILTLSLVMAYLSFIVSEHFFHVSGVMAVVTAALVLGAYGNTRISVEASQGLKATWEFIAFLCNSLLFLLVGLSVHPLEIWDHRIPIAIAILLVLVARGVAVFGLIPITTQVCRLPRIRRGESLIMWWGGLKGGLAIAVVLSIPETLLGRQLLLNLTLGVVLFTLLVNAPTIRPLIRLLGLDQLNETEKAELQDAMCRGQQVSTTLLKRLRQTHLISKASHQYVNQTVIQALSLPIASNINQQQRHLQMIALRAESEELDQLHHAYVVPQYVLLDLKSELQQEREKVMSGTRLPRAASSQRILSGLEQILLKKLREQDWLATRFSRYQVFRLSRMVQRDFARILMAEAALHALKKRQGGNLDHQAQLIAIYERHLFQMQQRLHATRSEFPQFFAGFATRLAMRIALTAVRQQANIDRQHGEMGTKVHTHLHHILSQALKRMPPLGHQPPTLSATALIKMIPLFTGLTEKTLAVLASHSPAITFLEGDTVIGEGDKGNALYIIAHGSVRVVHLVAQRQETILALLHEGDFFGEMALLGDQIRQATIIAQQPLTLLRLPHKDVLRLAKQYPEIGQRLAKAKEQRKQIDEKLMIS